MILSLLGSWTRRRRVSERLAPPPAPIAAAVSLRHSLQLRHVDAGSCNGCEMEITSVFGPVYDAERIGARLVASPRHADALLVTGPVTHNMAAPLERTYLAMPEPRLVIAPGRVAFGVTREPRCLPRLVIAQL